MSTVATIGKKVGTLEELLAFVRANARQLHARHTMTIDGVFGSFARREQTDESDVDLLVSFERLPALWSFYGIAEELEAALGRKVHLVHNDGSGFVACLQQQLAQP